MEATLAVVCDYAMLSLEGKLSVMGIFGQINPPVLPFQMPMMYLTVVFSVPPAELGQQKLVRLVLMDADGKEMLNMEQTVVAARPPGPGPAEINVVVGLANVLFEKSGSYQFSVLVGGEEKRSVPLRVLEPRTGG